MTDSPILSALREELERQHELEAAGGVLPRTLASHHMAVSGPIDLSALAEAVEKALAPNAKEKLRAAEELRILADDSEGLGAGSLGSLLSRSAALLDPGGES